MVMLFFMVPELAHATQMHSVNEGILVHQLGHVFFLVSMAILILTIQGKKLHMERGWRLIQCSALFFIIWNLDAMSVHFLDNQSSFITTTLMSMTHIYIDTQEHHDGLARLYYLLRLDHLFCLPAIIFLHRGLSHILQRKAP